MAGQKRIADAFDRPSLLAWWNGDERKALCRDFELTEQEVRDLYTRVKAKAEALNGRVAA